MCSEGKPISYDRLVKKYSIRKNTLIDYCNITSDYMKKIGLPIEQSMDYITVQPSSHSLRTFSEEDIEKVALFVRVMELSDFPVTRNDIYNAFEEIWKNKPINSDESPSEVTYRKAFNSLPADLKERSARHSAGNVRMKAATEKKIENYISLLGKVLEDTNLKDKPGNM